jgi:DtxR family Mn-dependent transcriptional regulator
MITIRQEDYLKEIFLLEITGREITVTDLAKRLRLSLSTITIGVRRLVKAKMLDHERYGSLCLTIEGRQKALLIYRRYEGLRAFFHELLGIDRKRSSEIACGMEHYMNASAANRLYALLEFFRCARAGQKYWVDEFFIATETRVPMLNPLSMLKGGEKGFVTQLTADVKLRKRLQNDGFTTGTRVTCLDASAVGSLRVSLNGTQLTIPRNEATAIWLRMGQE